MHHSGSSSTYFLVNAGHSTAILRPPVDGEEFLIWAKWLKGGAAAISLSAALALCWAAGTVRPLEATIQMERLAAKVEQTAVIHPNTARELARLMDQHGYDCNQVACGAQLHARNNAARNRLTGLIAMKAPAHKFVGVDPVTTGSVSVVAE